MSCNVGYMVRGSFSEDWHMSRDLNKVKDIPDIFYQGDHIISAVFGNCFFSLSIFLRFIHVVPHISTSFLLWLNSISF